MNPQTIETIYYAGRDIEKFKIINQILKSKLAVPEGSLTFAILDYMETKIKTEVKDNE